MPVENRVVDASAGAAPTDAVTNPFVRVTGLRKAFDAIVALHEVSFEVELGTTVSLLGPSGCGKTTVLRCLAGLETPDAGRISAGDAVAFDHERGVNLPPEARQVGMVFQSYAVWPHMTVGENVGFPLKIRRVPQAELEARVRDVLKLVGLDGLAARPATNLSGGQQQRVALARAIVHRPRLVLFDEPLSNLDAQLRHQMRTELKVLQGRLGFTAIYVTHDQEEALALSDKIIVMNHGRVEGIGTPRELFGRPTTPFVASFLGFENMYPGEVISANPDGVTPPENDGARPVAVRLEAGVTLYGVWQGRALVSAGASVVLAFRSEDVVLDPRGEPAPEMSNTMAGVVEAFAYLGARQDCLVKAGSLRVRATAQGNAAISPGERVMMRVRPEDCIILHRDNAWMKDNGGEG